MSQDKDNIPKNILIEESPFLGNLYPGVMSALREKYNSSFYMLLWNGEQSPYFSNNKGNDDVAIDLYKLVENSKKRFETTENTHVFKQARKYEDRFGIKYMRDIIQMDRRLATNFIPSASKSIHANINQEPLINIIKQINYFFDYFESFFTENNIDLLIIRPDSLFGATATYYAAYKKVPVTFVSASNYKSFATWMCGPFMSGKFVEQKMNEMKDSVQLTNDSESHVPQQARKFMNETAGQLGEISYLTRKLYNSTRDRIAHTINDIRKMRFPKRISYFSVISQHWRVYKSALFLDKNSKKNISDIVDRPYILFLLQVEPEYSTLCLAREFGHTEAIIYQLALSMPAGIQLVIKEHAPNIGNRSLDFYERLLRLPNLTMADYKIPGGELINDALAVVTISGSVGKESTRTGKPAIIFSTHVDYTHMPNIQVVTSMYDLPNIVSWAVKDREDAEIELWKEKGALLYQVLESISFEGKGLRLFGGDGIDMEYEQIIKAVDMLISMVAWQRVNGVPV